MSPSDTRVIKLIFFATADICIQRYVDVVAGKGAPFYKCFGFVDGTRVVYSHHTMM